MKKKRPPMVENTVTSLSAPILLYTIKLDARKKPGRGRPRKSQPPPEAAHPRVPFVPVPPGDFSGQRAKLAELWRAQPQRVRAAVDDVRGRDDVSAKFVRASNAQLDDFESYVEAVAAAIEQGDPDRVACYAMHAMRARALIEFSLHVELADLGRVKLASDRRRGRRTEQV